MAGSIDRYWAEELRDWRATGERLAQEIWDRLDGLKAELAGAHEGRQLSEEETRELEKSERDILL